MDRFRDSIVVSISACHADDPGSIPGRGDSFSSWSRGLLTCWKRVLRFGGDLAQMVERSLSMREALGSMPRFSSNFLSWAESQSLIIWLILMQCAEALLV